MTWAVTAFSDATVSLDVISRCIEKNILVMPKSSKGEELHSVADLARSERWDAEWNDGWDAGGGRRVDAAMGGGADMNVVCLRETTRSRR